MTAKIIWCKSTFILQGDQVSSENLSEILKSNDIKQKWSLHICERPGDEMRK